MASLVTFNNTSVFHRGALWLCYGFLRVDPSVMLVNIIGMALQFSYIIVYLIYVESKVSGVCVHVRAW